MKAIDKWRRDMNGPLGTGLRIRRRRLALGLTQKDLAQRSTITPATIGMIERGKYFRSRFLIDISVALNCSARWLAGFAQGIAPNDLVPMNVAQQRYVTPRKAMVSAIAAHALDSGMPEAPARRETAAEAATRIMNLGHMRQAEDRRLARLKNLAARAAQRRRGRR